MHFLSCFFFSIPTFFSVQALLLWKFMVFCFLKIHVISKVFFLKCVVKYSRYQTPGEFLIEADATSETLYISVGVRTPLLWVRMLATLYQRYQEQDKSSNMFCSYFREQALLMAALERDPPFPWQHPIHWHWTDRSKRYHRVQTT